MKNRRDLKSRRINNLLAKQDASNRAIRYYAIGFSVIGAFLLWATVQSYIIKDEEVSRSELQTITDVITNRAEITRGAKGSSSIRMQLKSFPAFTFIISGTAFESTYTSEYLREVRPGDTLELQIMRNEYRMKLSKEDVPGLWDKFLNYELIFVYNLKIKNRVYLNLLNYNHLRKAQSNDPIWTCGILTFFFLGGVVFLFKKSRL